MASCAPGPAPSASMHAGANTITTAEGLSTGWSVDELEPRICSRRRPWLDGPAHPRHDRQRPPDRAGRLDHARQLVVGIGHREGHGSRLVAGLRPEPVFGVARLAQRQGPRASTAHRRLRQRLEDPGDPGGLDRRGVVRLGTPAPDQSRRAPLALGPAGLHRDRRLASSTTPQGGCARVDSSDARQPPSLRRR